MLKKSFLLILFIVALTIEQYPQIKRVLYTLGANETVDYKECYLSLANNKEYIGFIINEESPTDYSRKSFFFFNGVKYGPWERIIAPMNLNKATGDWTFGVLKSNKFYIVHNGKEFGPYDDSPYQISSSSNSRNAFALIKKGLTYIFINGREFGPINSFGSPQFSSDETKFAFSFIRDEKGFVNINGTESGPFISTSELFLSNDGSFFVYSYEESAGVFGVNAGGTKFGKFSETGAISFNPASKKYGVPVKKGTKNSLLLNGTETGDYDVLPENLILDNNGVNYVYSYRKENKNYCNFSGKEFGPYTNSGTVYMNNAGTQWAYVYQESKTKQFLMENGVKKYEAKSSAEIFFAETGDSKLIVLTDSTVSKVFFNGQQIGTFSGAGGYKFSKNGSQYRFIYGDYGKYSFCVNGQNFGPYDDFLLDSFVFSNNNSNWGSIVYTGDYSAVVIGGKLLEKYFQTDNFDLIGNNYCFAALDPKTSKSLVNINGRIYTPDCFGVSYISVGTQGFYWYSQSGNTISLNYVAN